MYHFEEIDTVYYLNVTYWGSIGLLHLWVCDD